MHKSFPAASATIIRRQAVSREGEGGVIGKGELEEEGKEVNINVRYPCLRGVIMRWNRRLDHMGHRYMLGAQCLSLISIDGRRV